MPTEALSHCSQPWSGLQHYGYGPYTQSTLFDGMIHPFGTGPTSFSFGPGRPGGKYLIIQPRIQLLIQLSI